MASLDKQIMASGKPWVLMTCYVFAMRGGGKLPLKLERSAFVS